MTGGLATSTPRNGRGLAFRSRLWLVRPAYPAIRPPSIAVSGGEPATSGSSGLYGHSIRTPWACQARPPAEIEHGMADGRPHDREECLGVDLRLVMRSGKCAP